MNYSFTHSFIVFAQNSASEMTYIVSSGALNSTHSLLLKMYTSSINQSISNFYIGLVIKTRSTKVLTAEGSLEQVFSWCWKESMDDAKTTMSPDNVVSECQILEAATGKAWLPMTDSLKDKQQDDW